MYFIERNLSEAELTDFRKKVKIALIKNDLKIEDLTTKTGYSERSLKNAMKPSESISKFMISALAEALEIDISNYRVARKSYAKGDEEDEQN